MYKRPTHSELFSGNFDFRPEKYGRMNFRPEFFWVFKISTGKFLGFSTFDRKNFRFFKFRGQKKSGFSDPGAGSLLQDLRRRSELVV
jgi:hypothetical protein